MSARDDHWMLSQLQSGSPMGNLLRQFWVPVIRSEALIAGGAPTRVRLFCNAFVAFRSPDGGVAIFDEACPHRGVSLALGRNEEGGLRCIFHGWKMDMCGKVTECPTEPAERRAAFAAHVKFNHYPTREVADIVWAWFGGGEPAEFPIFDFSELEKPHYVSFVGLLNCHWIQVLEMLLDPVHVGILHKDQTDPALRRVTRNGQQLSLRMAMTDPPPTIEVEHTDYGYRGAAIRVLDDGSQYVRVTEWVMPFSSFLSAKPGDVRSLYMAVPVDEENTQLWYVGWDSQRPLAVDTLKANALGGADPNNFTAGIGTRAELWFQDRRKMLQGHFTGFPTGMHEEVIVPQAQGIRQNFATQNLGWSDRMIIATRDRLKQAALQFEARGFTRGRADLRTLNPTVVFSEGSERWQDVTGDRCRPHSSGEH